MGIIGEATGDGVIRAVKGPVPEDHSETIGGPPDPGNAPTDRWAGGVTEQEIEAHSRKILGAAAKQVGITLSISAASLALLNLLNPFPAIMGMAGIGLASGVLMAIKAHEDYERQKQSGHPPDMSKAAYVAWKSGKRFWNTAFPMLATSLGWFLSGVPSIREIPIRDIFTQLPAITDFVAAAKAGIAGSAVAVAVRSVQRAMEVAKEKLGKEELAPPKEEAR